MTEVKAIVDRICRIQAQVPNVFSVFTVYFIDETKTVLFDPGPTKAVPAILRALAEMGRTELSYIVLTHIHMDHAGGAGELARLFPRAKVLVHPWGLPHLADPSRLIESTKKAYGPDFETSYGSLLPVARAQLQPMDDGATLDLDQRHLTFVHAPGHSHDHMVALDSLSGGLFCGEALGIRTKSASGCPLPNASPPGFDYDLYLNTIERLAALRPRLLFYAHDGVGKEPEALMEKVAETTKIVGSLIEGAVAEGQPIAAIRRSVEQYVTERLSIDLAEVDLGLMVAGYVHYYQRRPGAGSASSGK